MPDRESTPIPSGQGQASGELARNDPLLFAVPQLGRLSPSLVSQPHLFFLRSASKILQPMLRFFILSPLSLSVSSVECQQLFLLATPEGLLKRSGDEKAVEKRFRN